jgi:hypothetical protein
MVVPGRDATIWVRITAKRVLHICSVTGQTPCEVLKEVSAYIKDHRDGLTGHDKPSEPKKDCNCH